MLPRSFCYHIGALIRRNSWYIGTESSEFPNPYIINGACKSVLINVGIIQYMTKNIFDPCI